MDDRRPVYRRDRTRDPASFVFPFFHEILYQEARKKFHLTGNKKKLYFDKVYNQDIETYLVEKRFANDHPCMVGMSQARRTNMVLKSILSKSWNNLRSPGNPRNYFHGKVEPCGLDEFGNLIFEYVEHSYEQQWKNEGIDLKR